MTHQDRKATEAMEMLLSRVRQDQEPFTFGDRTYTPAEIIEHLAPLMTEKRLARINQVLSGRTYTVTTVVEGLINTGNVNAVMRSAEALGFQSFHVIEADAEAYKTSARESQGAEKWLDTSYWPTPQACAEALKENGYTLIATHLDDAALPLETFDFTQQTALIFGNERDGVSPALLKLADYHCIVPTPGFTQSFNISVAAAICLYHAYCDRLTRQGFHGDLSPEQAEHLRALWCLRSVRHAARVLEYGR